MVNRYGLLEKYLHLSDVNALIVIKGGLKSDEPQDLVRCISAFTSPIAFLFSKYQSFWKS